MTLAQLQAQLKQARKELVSKLDEYRRWKDSVMTTIHGKEKVAVSLERLEKEFNKQNDRVTRLATREIELKEDLGMGNCDFAHARINDIYTDLDEGEIDRVEAKKMMTRVCERFLGIAS